MTQTRNLQTLWWDWIGTSERLVRALHEQTAAIMLRDIERLEELQPDIERLMESLREADERAAEAAQRLAEDLGATKPGLRGLLERIEDATEAEQLQALANRVRVAAQTIQGLVRKNEALIENELAYIGGTFHLLAQSAQQKGPYQTADRAAVLMDEVA